MTPMGPPVDMEFAKLLALQSQRLAVIGIPGACLFIHPKDPTAWGVFGAAVTDLFHAAKMNGTK